MTIAFYKMHGLGNDFVVIDRRNQPFELDRDRVRLLSDRKRGIGCDQLIALDETEGPADAFMRIWNADGGEVEACGNATRCIARLLAEETGKPTSSVETVVGILGCQAHGDGTATVDMGAPKFEWEDIPLSRPMDTRRLDLQLSPIDAQVFHEPAAVNVGNPHCVFFVDDVSALDLEAFGPLIEHHRLFPERTNVEVAEVRSRKEIRMRVWERGTGITQACGTGACATAVTAARLGRASRKVDIILDGGTLNLEWREADDHMLMTGPATMSFRGTLTEDLMG